MLVFMAFSESRNLGEAALETGALIGLFIVLPLILIYWWTMPLPDRRSYRADPTLYLKQHPREILLLGLVFGPTSWAVLRWLAAPAPLLQTLVALLAVAFVAALINLGYRLSFHLAAVTVLVYMAVHTWGAPLLILLTAIPLIAWAKYDLHEHTFMQMALGVMLALFLTPLAVHLL